MSNDKGLRGRMARQGEEAIGKMAQELLENPVVNRALAATFEARERATRAQELAMSALNLPSAADLDRLTRRLRSVSQRIEGLEEGLDRIADRLDSSREHAALEQRLEKLEKRMASIDRTLTRLDKKFSATG